MRGKNDNIIFFKMVEKLYSAKFRDSESEREREKNSQYCNPILRSGQFL